MIHRPPVFLHPNESYTLLRLYSKHVTDTTGNSAGVLQIYRNVTFAVTLSSEIARGRNASRTVTFD